MRESLFRCGRWIGHKAKPAMSFIHRNARAVGAAVAVGASAVVTSLCRATDPPTEITLPASMNPIQVGQDVVDALGGVIPAGLVAAVGISLVFWMVRLILPSFRRRA